MYNMQTCIAGDSYQLSYEHPRQLDCAGHFRTPAESSPFILPSAKHQMHESFSGNEGGANCKRPLSHLCGEGVNKRARLGEKQADRIESFDETLLSIFHEGTFSEEVEWRAPAVDVNDDDGKSFADAGTDQLDEFYFRFSEHSHWRRMLVGAEHQADLPHWTCSEPEMIADKLCGTCVVPMPDCDSEAAELQIRHDCAVEGSSSIGCTRRNVMAARENLSRELGQEKFALLGFSDMGEAVAERWTGEDERLFHEVVLSNPSSSGRNFWHLLAVTFPYRDFKDLVSYYFNVFMLRKRAHQNRFDRSNVDSDYDSDTGFVVFDEGEEEEKGENLDAPLQLANDANRAERLDLARQETYLD